MGKRDEKMIAKWFDGMKSCDEKRIATLTLADGVEEFTDLDYINGNGSNEYHLMNIYRPKDRDGEVLPVIFDIHGGGWGYGDKEIYKFYCYALATRGFAVVSFNYTLFPVAKDISVIVKDIFAALNYSAESSEKYGLDKNNYFLTGDSAGGHLAGMTLAITLDSDLKKLYEVDSEIKFNAVVFNCAVYNPNRYARIPLPVVRTFIGRFYNHDKIFRSNKYFKSVNVNNARLDKFPPVYLISCFNDMSIVREETAAFARLLSDKGVFYIYEFAKKEDCKNEMGHVYSVLHPLDWSEAVRTNDNVCEFFKSNIKANEEK